MTLLRLLIARGCATRASLLTCAFAWLIAFAYSPVISPVGSLHDVSSQVIYSTCVLSVILTFLAVHGGLGRRCLRLRLLTFTPASPLRLLGECALATVAIAVLLTLASFVLSQLAPWYQVDSAAGRDLGAAFVCLALISSWLALTTLAIHIWLEPELSLPVALGVLFLFLRAGLDPLLPDPTAPHAALIGELSWPGFLFKSGLWLAMPLAIGRAGLSFR